VILSDISIHPERYNQFAVVEGSTFTLDAGEFEYQVYAQTSSTNLSPALANELVESGILKVEFDVTRNYYEVTLNEKIYEIEQPTQIIYLLLENGDFCLLESGYNGRSKNIPISDHCHGRQRIRFVSYC
jgi:hypothetical protein